MKREKWRVWVSGVCACAWGGVCLVGLGVEGRDKKCLSQTFTWKAFSRWKAGCFTISRYIFLFSPFSLTLLYCCGPCAVDWCESKDGPPPLPPPFNVWGCPGDVIDSHGAPTQPPSNRMTCVQPFASPEADLEGAQLFFLPMNVIAYQLDPFHFPDFLPFVGVPSLVPPSPLFLLYSRGW